MARPVVIEAALNGGRDRAEQPATPYTPEEVAMEAHGCAEAGACLVRLHARTADGAWSADPAWYTEAFGRIRAAAPDLLISVPSLRPVDVPVAAILDLLTTLASSARTRPDLVSVNLGHIVIWEPVPAGDSNRRTVYFPNDYADVVAVLAACRAHGIRPELGVMDLGFVSNAVALRDDGVLPVPGWFLLELDSSADGAGPQVAPATVANYDVLAARLRAHFLDAAWAAHGVGRPGYAVLRRVLARGAHIQVGFEDAVHLPDGRLAASNAELVAWAVDAARDVGREPASSAIARSIIGAHH